jgi:hypothetical protein
MTKANGLRWCQAEHRSERASEMRAVGESRVVRRTRDRGAACQVLCSIDETEPANVRTNRRADLLTEHMAQATHRKAHLVGELFDVDGPFVNEIGESSKCGIDSWMPPPGHLRSLCGPAQMVKDPLHRLLSARPIVRSERANQSRHRVSIRRKWSVDPIAPQTIASNALGVDEHDHDVNAMITKGVRRVWIEHHDWTCEGMAGPVGDDRTPAMHHDLKRVMGVGIRGTNRPAV